MTEIRRQQPEGPSEPSDGGLATFLASLTSDEGSTGAFERLLSEDFKNPDNFTSAEVEENNIALAEFAMRLLHKTGVLEDIYPSAVEREVNHGE